MTTELEHAIYRTAAWFSVFCYPLTVFEIWKWLYHPDRKYSFAEIYEALEKSEWLSTQLQSTQGFFSLRSAGDIEELVSMRQERFLDAMRKYKKLRLAVKYFSLFPSVESVAVGNTLAWWHTRPDSDIDLFITVRPGTVWVTRFFLVLPFALLGKRPKLHEDDSSGKDTFCFSFFVASDRLSMQSLSLEENDPYLAYWTVSLVPIFDRTNIFEKFEMENQWVSKFLPHARSRTLHRKLCSGFKKALPLNMSFFERITKKIQMKKLPDQIRHLANTDSRVVINDQMLKFHSNDRRAEYRERFEKLIKHAYGS
jgi:hypothetical protein